MKIGQLVFLLAAVAFAVYATRLRSTLADRLIYIMLAGAGFVLVLYPGWSTEIAHRIGIGRGVDLVIYLFIVFSLFHYASGAAKARQMERAITAIVRERAIATAIPDSMRGPGDALRTSAEDECYHGNPSDLPSVPTDRR